MRASRLSADIDKKLDKAIANIITFGDSFFRFLVGGMGQFDGMCSAAVCKAKYEHKDKQISLELVLVCARLRHVAGTQWGNKKYMNMKHLEAVCEDASAVG